MVHWLLNLLTQSVHNQRKALPSLTQEWALTMGTGKVAHACHPATWEANGRKIDSWRLGWATQ